MRKLYKNSDDAEQRLPTQSAATPAWESLRSLLSALSLSRSPTLFAANWDAACDESWRMNQMLNSTDRSVAVAVAVDADVAARIATVANCLPKVFNCFNWQYVIRQFESFQSLGHDFASRQAAAWACSQTGTATPAMAICLSRLAHMATPAANKLSSYRFIALSTVGVGFVALATLQASSAQLARYRSIDLSTYRVYLLVANTSAQRLLPRRWVTAACVGVAATRRVQKINKWIKNYRNRNRNWKCNKNNPRHEYSIDSLWFIAHYNML